MSKQSDKSSFDYELNPDDPGKGLWVVVGIIILIVGAFIFVGRQAAASYGVRGTPTLIVVGGQGQPTDK